MTGQDSVRIAEDFNRHIGVTGLILTKMDGDSRGGAALSIRYVTGIPIKYIGTGEKTNALDIFYPDRMASRIMGKGDVLSLIEKAEKSFDQQQTKKLEDKFRRAEFDLGDFLEQLKQLKNMGPLNQIIQLLPGIPKLPSSLLDGSEEKQLKKLEAIVLSMTPAERAKPEIINGTRRKRIASGSGTTSRDVNQLLSQFTQMKKIAKIAAQGKLPKKFTDTFRK